MRRGVSKQAVLAVASLWLAGMWATSQAQALDLWHGLPDTAPILAVGTAITQAEQTYRIEVRCDARQPPAHAIALRMVSNDRTLPASSGTITFGNRAPEAVHWRRDGASAKRADVPGLASALAQVFRSHQVITVDEPTLSTPLQFTFGAGPYEPVVSDFLTACPPTRALMPTLVRIRTAQLIDTPSDQSSSSSARYLDPKHLNANYPADAVRQHQQGEVKLIAALTPDGEILWPEVIKSSGYALLDNERLRWFRHVHALKQPQLNAGQLYLLHQQLKFSLPD